MPSTCPRIIIVDGVQYIYDVTRGKIVSAARIYLRAGMKHHSVSNKLLRLEDGQPTGIVGDALPRPSVITSITANCKANATWNLKIYKKNSAVELVNLPIINNIFGYNTSLNEDLDVGDVLIFKAEGSDIPYPRALIELAWRL